MSIIKEAREGIQSLFGNLYRGAFGEKHSGVPGQEMPPANEDSDQLEEGNQNVNNLSS